MNVYSLGRRRRSRNKKRKWGFKKWSFHYFLWSKFLVYVVGKEIKSYFFVLFSTEKVTFQLIFYLEKKYFFCSQSTKLNFLIKKGITKRMIKEWRVFSVWAPFTIDIDGPEDGIDKVLEAGGKLWELLAHGHTLKTSVEFLNRHLSVLEMSHLGLKILNCQR